MHSQGTNSPARARHLIEMTAPIPFDKAIEESSLGRIWQLISQPKHSFTVISPFLSGSPPEENEARFVELKDTARKNRWGYTQFNSGYTYTDTKLGDDGVAQERSLLLIGPTKSQAVALAKAYKQESILWKDDEGFVLLGTTSHNDGQIIVNFQRQDRNLTFDPAILKTAFSALVRANRSQRGRQFAFKQESAFVHYLPELQGVSNHLRAVAEHL